MTKKEVIKHIEKISKDIKDIKIQGATNIAVSGINAIVFALSHCEFNSKEEFFDFVYKYSDLIKNARPTEPMLFNGLKYILFNIEKNKNKNLTFLINNSIKNGKYFLDLISKTSIKSIEYGSKLIKNNNNILTHCHSSSVVKTFILAKKKGVKFHVYNTETRPLFQGRLTSMDLVENGIKNTMIVDSEAPYLIANTGINDEYPINSVIIGCDAIGMSGAIINKVGSFGIGLACLDSKVPLYISGNLLKIDVTDEIPVESRDFKEVWESSPKNFKILNFAFDLVPKKYISGIITEFGIINPKDIKKIVKDKYPFMFYKNKHIKLKK